MTKSLSVMRFFFLFLLGFLPLWDPPFLGAEERSRAQQAEIPTVLFVTARKQERSVPKPVVGRVESASTVQIQARVEGFLEQQLFEDGAEVREGELLYTIEDGTYRANLAQAEAQRDGAKATLANAQIELERQSILLKKGDVPPSTVDSATAEAKSAQAQLDQAIAQVETAQITLGYTQIRSPLAGRISKTAVTPGNLVSSQTGVLATISSIDPIRVRFYLGEKDLLAERESGRIGLNTAALEVQLVLSDGHSYAQKGRIAYTDPVVDENSDTVELYAVFPNSDAFLMPGQFVTVFLVERTPQQVFVLPERAVAYDQRGYFVFILTEKNTIQRQDVMPLTRAGGFWSIAAGLTEGMRVVVEGTQRIQVGMTVAPKPFVAQRQQSSPALQQTVPPSTSHGMLPDAVAPHAKSSTQRKGVIEEVGDGSSP